MVFAMLRKSFFGKVRIEVAVLRAIFDSTARKLPGKHGYFELHILYDITVSVPKPTTNNHGAGYEVKAVFFRGKMLKVTRCKSTSFIMQLTQCTKEHQRTWLMLLDVVDSNNNNDNLILPFIKTRAKGSRKRVKTC